ncbi:unnamed protein product [Strongylus vulgaris]|uniref:Peptidase A1 domain-containing protein n=1 Tax=Strongylus vulgaris TaxID=40348 RepID=A0A3P7JWJ7_STRVU|nr:unnamed protein product [Strongylus vulgaris]
MEWFVVFIVLPALIHARQNYEEQIRSDMEHRESVPAITVPLYAAEPLCDKERCDVIDGGFTHKVTIGGQDFEVLLNTHRVDAMLWIPHINCTSGCGEKKFDPSKSTSFKKVRNWIGFDAAGMLGDDTIAVSVPEIPRLIPKKKCKLSCHEFSILK